jgi:spore coat protein JB
MEEDNMEQMLNDIGVIGFVLTDLSLYLDTHPDDRNALEYFNHYAGLKKRMVKDFSQKYYPLVMEYSDCNNEWRWGMAPMPWEGECG